MGAWVRSLGPEDPCPSRASQPLRHDWSLSSRAWESQLLKPVAQSPAKLKPRAGVPQAPKSLASTAHAPRQGKPLQ